MKYILLFFAFSSAAFAADSMEKNLEALNIPDDQISPTISRDKLYVLNTRYSSLTNRHEMTIFGANNFTADSHLISQNAGLTYRYHINPRWSVGLRHSEYYNKLSPAGKKLMNNKFNALLPDTDYAKSSDELFGCFNLFYGKMRMTQKDVIYFDQFVSLGLGRIDLASENTNMGSLDLGVAIWMGQHWSSRIGVRNEFYKQTNLRGEKSVHNANGYVEFGYLFGEGSRI
jgi:outer membrane beta-barrel protein